MQQQQTQSLFGGGGGLFGAQNQFNQASAFGSQQNLFNVQNQMSTNFANFNQVQQNPFNLSQQQTFGYNNYANNLFGGNNDLLMTRQVQKSQFQALEECSEYCETGYYQNTMMSSRGLFTNSEFWADLAAHIIKTGSIAGFQSSSFVHAHNNINEMVCSWAVLDLDYQSKRHIIRARGGKGISVKPESNIIVFKKEIKEAEADLDTNILVIHRTFESNNRGSETKLKEYLTHQVYGCEVIITNVSSKMQNFQILWQIPEGSLPVSSTNYQKSENKSLAAYSTIRFEFFFYFPKEGIYQQFPSNITIDDKVVAVSNKCSYNVCLEGQETSFETFNDILISGNKQVILDFLRTANLLKGEKGFSFYNMYWMLSDKEFYSQVIEILRERRIFDQTVWNFGFKHFDEAAIRERIQHDHSLLSRFGTFFETSLVKCTPEASEFRHLDYFPIINARAHSVGKNINAGLLNQQFRSTYYKFLSVLVEKKELSTSDWLQLAYYFLLQDRIKETIQIITGDRSDFSSGTAAKISQKISPDDIQEGSALKIQYDYMVAYLDFFTGLKTNFKTAREIAKQYEQYPVISWRVLFTEILDQINEYDGVEEPDFEIDQEDEEKKKQNLKKSKRLEPFLECEIEGKQIAIEYANISKVKVKYYVIDLEVLFTRTPFLVQNNQDLANAKPIKVEEYYLESNMKS